MSVAVLDVDRGRRRVSLRLVREEEANVLQSSVSECVQEDTSVLEIGPFRSW